MSMNELEIKVSLWTPEASAKVLKVCVSCNRKGTCGNNPSGQQIQFGLHFAFLPMCRCVHHDGHFTFLLSMTSRSVGHKPFQSQLFSYEAGWFLLLSRTPVYCSELWNMPAHPPTTALQKYLWSPACVSQVQMWDTCANTFPFAAWILSDICFFLASWQRKSWKCTSLCSYIHLCGFHCCPIMCGTAQKLLCPLACFLFRLCSTLMFSWKWKGNYYSCNF